MKPLSINYLGIEETAAIQSAIEHKFKRLEQVCNSIRACQVKLAATAIDSERSASSSYLVSVSLRLPQGVELYSLRLPANSQDSLKQAIADVFARIFRQLIELQIEENYLLNS